MSQLTRIAAISGALRWRRCPYQANVMNTLDISSRTTVFMACPRLLFRTLLEKVNVLLSPIVHLAAVGAFDLVVLELRALERARVHHDSDVHVLARRRADDRQLTHA